MLSRARWDAVVALGSLVILAGLLLPFRSDDTARMVVAVASVALFLIGYAVAGRPAIGRVALVDLAAGSGFAGGDGVGIGPVAAWRFPVFLAVAAVAVGVGAAAVPFMAMLQTLAYPLAWVIGDTRRRGIAGSAVIAASVFTGTWLGHGADAESALAGGATGVFSLVFAIAIGLWIASIAEWGEERERLLAELTAAQNQVEALSREQGAAAERERLARDIHDTLAQTLAGLVIFAERAGRQSRDGQTDAAATTIATVEQVARDALAEARALVARTASVPREPAFGAAIERLVERFRAHGAARIELDATGIVGDLDREAQVVLLRCLQEALSNVMKHAGAGRVGVRVVVAADGAAELSVTDDGRGFDPARPAHGFGLEGMRERVSLAGGGFAVESAPGAGTTLEVRLPVAPATDRVEPLLPGGAA